MWVAFLQVRLPAAEGLCFALRGLPHTARPAHGFLLGASNAHACGLHDLQFQAVSGVGWGELSSMSCCLRHDTAKPRAQPNQVAVPCRAAGGEAHFQWL